MSTEGADRESSQQVAEEQFSEGQRSAQRGGKRRGAGRKRKYEGGYSTVKDVLWKTISIHFEVFQEWVEERDRRGFKNNSHFAQFLLANTRGRDQNQSQRLLSPTPSIRTDDFLPTASSTPQMRQHMRSHLFTEGSSRLQGTPEQRHERVFLDTVVSEAALQTSILYGTESETDSEVESGEDVSYESSSSASDEDVVEELLPAVKNLDITYDNELMSHVIQDEDNDKTVLESVDMDISELGELPIEVNIPVMSSEQQQTMQGMPPKTALLPETYVDEIKEGVTDKVNLVMEKKVVCCSSKMQELFQFCMDRDCNMPVVELKENYVGCVLEMRWLCKAGHRGDWQSSKKVNNVYINNIQAASSLLFTGNNFVKLSLFAKCFQLAFFSESTFHAYQRKYVAPEIHAWWNVMQMKMFENLKDQPVVVSGDGQMDSPGFSAKTCTYTLMHAELDYVLHVEVVDVRHSQLKSSVMEKVGCQRALDNVRENINVVELVTDASSQIIKLLATNPKYADVAHQLDVWHKSNKLDKKLIEASRKSGNAILRDWVAAIRNHFWHCSKECKDDLGTLKEMWVNVLKHVANEHTWYNGKCSHGALEVGARQWLQKDSPAMEALRQIVLDKGLLKSLPFYTRFRHTGKLESYHSLRLMYAPKRCGFTYEGVVLRSLLAAIDHNHHVSRQQARNCNGDLVFSRRWSKRAKRWKVVVVKEKKNYSYFPVLCAKVLQAISSGASQPISYENDPKLIAATIAALPAPPTSELVREHMSRF